MADRRLPETDARLSTSAFFEVEVEDSANPGNMVISRIGAINQFREASPRRTAPRYQFDDDNPGEIIERIPDLVDRTLNIQRAVLYHQDMLQAFGSSGLVDIIQMKAPFNIVKYEKYPDSYGAEVIKATKYIGCWLHDNPKTYDLSGGLTIVQGAEIGYTRKEVVTTSGVDKGADGSQS